MFSQSGMNELIFIPDSGIRNVTSLSKEVKRYNVRTLGMVLGWLVLWRMAQDVRHGCRMWSA